MDGLSTGIQSRYSSRGYDNTFTQELYDTSHERTFTTTSSTGNEQILPSGENLLQGTTLLHVFIHRHNMTKEVVFISKILFYHIFLSLWYKDTNSYN